MLYIKHVLIRKYYFFTVLITRGGGGGVCVCVCVVPPPGGVRLSPLGTLATVGLLYQPRMIDDDDYGAADGMRIGRGNRSTTCPCATLSTTNRT
jgi:hypothetical protein